MTAASGELFALEQQSAASRSAALLRKLDSTQQPEASTRVTCIEPGCRSELICLPSHVDNLETSWRCIEHRQTTTSKARSE